MRYEIHNEPWKIRDEDFPWSADGSEQLKFMLNYAVLAPSIYNTQPWLFKVTRSEVALYVDRARSLPVADPSGRSLIVSCGAALFHLRIAMRHFGYEPVVRTFPDLDMPDLLAFVRLGGRKDPTAEEERLFKAIRERRTIRSRFQNRTVSARTLEMLQAAAEQEGARLHLFRNPDQQQELTDLVREAYEIRQSDGPFKRELDRWTTPRQPRRPLAPVNVPGHLAGTAPPHAHRVRRGLERHQLLMWDEDIEAGESVFAVLSTPGDQMASWLSAGQALSRVLLTAAGHGLSAAFFNQPMGIGHVRTRVRELVGDDVYPQMIFRIGYGVPDTPTHRLPLRQVVPQGGDRT